MDGNATGAPHFAQTAHAPGGSLPGDRWTGSTIGKYHVLRRLGRGGMGVVYEAKDPVLDRAVAVKVLRDNLASNPDSVRKFLREARTAAKLNHPHIVAVYEADQQEGMCYLVMELMEGASAHDRVSKSGAFDWVEATMVVAEVCRGLVAVHAAGLIHRDVKPSNIMRSRDGKVKLADFGLALTSTPNPSGISSLSNNVVGTPLYMSPEQCRAELLDHRTDLYSLGATYYTLLTGEPPFDGPSPTDIMFGHCSQTIPDPRELNPSVPAPCAEVVLRTMAKKLADRPASSEELLAALESVLRFSAAPDPRRLKWATTSESNSAPSTLVDPVQAATPEGSRSLPPQGIRSRSLIVAACVVFMGTAFGLSRYYSQARSGPPSVTTKAPQKPMIDNPLVEYQPQPIVKEKPKVPSLDRPPHIALPRGPIEFDAGGQVNSLAFDPSDPNVLSWGTDRGAILVRKVGAPKEFCRETVTKEDRPLRIAQVAYFPNTPLWAALFNGSLHFYTTPDYSRDAKLDGAKLNDDPARYSLQTRSILRFAFHPSGKFLALGFENEYSGKGGGIVFRRLSKNVDDAVHFLGDLLQPPTCVAFSIDGSLCAAGASNGKLYVWKISGNDSGYLVEFFDTLALESGEISAIVALSNNQFAVAAGSSVILCDVKNRVTKAIHQGKETIDGLTVDPRGKHLAWNSGHSIVLYNLNLKRIQWQLNEHSAPISSLSFDRDGKQLASGDTRGKVRIWTISD